MERKVIILGAGCAGLTAALYTARGKLEPLVIEGVKYGGQLMLTAMVENYPGFPEGVLGPDLIQLMRKQAERFGTEFLTKDAEAVDLNRRPFTVWAGEEVFRTKALIIATGASARLLDLESEQRLLGRGVSTCATCDGFFFQDQEVMVVGGGDSAMEEALFLTKYATHVTIVHRRDKLRASKIMQERAFKNPKISFIWNTTIDDILDPDLGRVTGVKLRNLQKGEVAEKPCNGVFIAIGHIPNTQLFQGQLDLDEKGYIITYGGTRTNVPGVFATGDAVDHTYRQAITAAGTGCMAAIDIERFLEGLAH